MQLQPSTQRKKIEKLENNYFIYSPVNGGSKLTRPQQQISIFNSGISSKGS